MYRGFVENFSTNALIEELIVAEKNMVCRSGEAF